MSSAPTSAPRAAAAARSRRSRMTAASMGIGSARRISVALRLIGILALLAGAALLTRSAPPPGAAAPPPTATAADAAARPTSAVAGSTGSPRAPVPIPDGFRVRVPRLRIDLPIAEGVIERDIEQQRTPERYAFHLPGSAIPGERGNAYVYSHARAGMFLTLWDARVGDK